MNHKDEILVQMKALLELSHGNNEMVDQVLSLQPLVPEIFRAVINDHESNTGRVPTTDELIWLASELLDYDIRELFKGGE